MKWRVPASLRLPSVARSGWTEKDKKDSGQLFKTGYALIWASGVLGQMIEAHSLRQSYSGDSMSGSGKKGFGRASRLHSGSTAIIGNAFFSKSNLRGWSALVSSAQRAQPMWNKLFCMALHCKEQSQDKANVPSSAGCSPALSTGSNGDPLQVLAEFYESGQGLDEEENEVDLMIQLSGMVFSHAQGHE